MEEVEWKEEGRLRKLKVKKRTGRLKLVWKWYVKRLKDECRDEREGAKGQ